MGVELAWKRRKLNTRTIAKMKTSNQQKKSHEVLGNEKDGKDLEGTVEDETNYRSTSGVLGSKPKQKSIKKNKRMYANLCGTKYDVGR